jgi:outer membrane protein
MIARKRLNRPALPGSVLRGMTALAAVLACAGAAQAQSLKALFEAAQGYDATYISARKLAEAAQYRAEQANALYLPTVGASLGHVRSQSQVSFPRSTSISSNSTTAGVQVSQSLFNAANNATFAQSRRALELANLDLRSAEQDLIIRVAQAYFDVLSARAAVATAQANRSGIGEQLAAAKRNFEVGTATITDTREAQARFDLALAQELAAQNDFNNKQEALAQLVGKPDAAPKALAKPVSLPVTQPAVVDPWVNEALSQHPVVKKAELGLDISRLEIDKAKAGHLPTVGATASLGFQRPGTATLTNGGNSHNATVGVTVTVPLFAGFAIQNRVKETLALEEKSQSDLDAARRGVTLATKQAFLGVQSGFAQVKAFEAAEASSQLALEATQLGYKVGVKTNLDVLNAQTQLFSTRSNLARARHDVLMGGLRLRQASGQLKAEDLGNIEPLLEP